MQRFARAVVLVVCVASFGCGAGTTIERGTENIKVGMQSLAKGVADLDPVGLRKLFDSNEALRQQLESVQAALARADLGQMAIKVATTDTLDLVVVHYTGDMFVTGWVDSRSNEFWTSIRIAEAAAPFPIALDAAHQGYLNTVKSLPMMLGGQQPPIPLPQLKVLTDAIDAEYVQRFAAAWSAHQAHRSANGTSVAAINLLSRTRVAGPHIVKISVRPAVHGSPWQLSYKIVHRRHNQAEAVVSQGTIDSSSNPAPAGSPSGVTAATFSTVP